MNVFPAPSPLPDTHLADSARYAEAAEQVRLRHVFVVEGRAIGDYVERPLKQVEAICRKRGRYTFGLWRFLKQSGKLRRQTQRLDPITRTWGQV